VARLAEEVFTLPGALATRLNRRIVVALDEFSGGGGVQRGGVEQTLRAASSSQRQVGYVFAGSEPSLMEQMIGPKRPFYKAGPSCRLGKIPAGLLAARRTPGFKLPGCPRNLGGAAIVDLAGNLPYDVQRLAHETWDDVAGIRRKTVGLDDLHATAASPAREQDTLFEAVWQRLTLAQRANPPRGRPRATASRSWLPHVRARIASAARLASRPPSRRSS